jgi:alpha-tubulin suppressor-like RCC1 family protein
LTNSGHIYACGANTYGQLGFSTGSTTNSSVTGFQRISLSTTIKIVDIAASGYTSYFVTSTGQVYACGYNENGELGIADAPNGSYNKPNLAIIPGLGNVQAVSANAYLSHAAVLFLHYNGTVSSMGINNYGQLGRITPSSTKSVPNLGLIPGLANIVQTAVGGIYQHSLFLDRYGKVYSCGNSASGCLGRIANSGSTTVINLGQIPNLSNIISISASSPHGNLTSGNQSFFIDANYNAFSCGYNANYQLGHSTATGSATVSNLNVIPSRRFLKIASCGQATVYLLTNGQVLCSGIEANNNLNGVGSSSSSVIFRTLLSTQDNIDIITAGYREFTYIIKKDGSVWSCGYNSQNVLGDPNRTSNNYKLDQVPNLNINQ